MQIKGGPLLQKQLVHNATIASIVPRWQTFEASQFELQVCHDVICCCAAQIIIQDCHEHAAARELHDTPALPKPTACHTGQGTST